jgi:pyruvate/2-oxoacid:ferredoxin oxidoreductase beta subunit
MSSPSKNLKELKPLEEYWEKQGQFRHLKDAKWDDFKKEIQAQVNHDWEVLKKRCGIE